MFKQAVSRFPVVLLTGPRQSGKTTFLKEMMRDNAEYVTFDDPVTREFAESDPRGFLDQFAGNPVILDEFQYAPGLLPYIRMNVDKNRRSNGRWLLTGSQQFNVMKNVSESLAGRIAVLNLLPFHFLEHKRKTIGGLEDAVWRGGYPENVIFPDQRDMWLSSYMGTYIERDVRQIQNIQSLSLFQSFLSPCAANHSRELSYSTISKQLGISLPTAREWISIACASFIMIQLQPYYENFGKRLIKSPKIYFLDSAIAAYLTRQTSPETLFAGPMSGAFFEGFIISEVYKLQMCWNARPSMYFWRSHDQTEVNLLIERDNIIYPIEIKKTATPTSGHAGPLRKFRSFVKGRKTAPGQVVCTVKKRTRLSTDAEALPFREFLEWVGSM